MTAMTDTSAVTGAVSEERIDESVRRIFETKVETKAKLGLLDTALAEKGLS